MKIRTPRNWQTGLLLLVAIGILFLAASGYLGSVMRTTLDPLIGVQRWITSRYLAVYDFMTVPRDVASLRQRNLELESQTSQLQSQVVQLQQQLSEAQLLYALLDFARERPGNEYIAAAVVGRDPSPFLHYVIIDHGSDDGIRHGMPVVTDRGLVGRIDAVTAGAARVQLITDTNAAVNVHLKNSQTDALLTGSITGDLTLEMIDQDVILQQGDLVLSSGLGANYPADVMVGQLVSIRKKETDLFQSASVQPAVDFTSLRAVLVIANFRPVDIQPLIPVPAQ